MGCVVSSDHKEAEYIDFDRRLNHEDIEVGKEAMRRKPTVIFIFGGPGSCKGTIVDNMLCMYGAKLVNVDELFREQRTKLVHAGCNNDDNAARILKKYDSRRLFEALTTAVTTDKNSVHLFDVIPSLKVLMRAKFLHEDCSMELNRFQSVYPVSFAIYLDVVRSSCSHDDLLLQPQTRWEECLSREHQIDFYRMAARIRDFQLNSRQFLRYFFNRKLMVTVKVNVHYDAPPGNVWRSLYRTLGDLEFRPIRCVSTVVLFEFEDDRKVAIDLEKYVLESVVLKDIIEPIDGESPCTLLQTLRNYIRQKATTTESFIVQLSGTTLACQTAAPTDLVGERLKFRDITLGHLEDYLPGRPAAYVRDPALSLPLKVIGSSESEVCLFPVNVSDLTCLAIASMFMQTATTPDEQLKI